MKDWHVYAQAEKKPGFKEMRREAFEAVNDFLFSGTKPVHGDVVRFYCHMYALEVAYQGSQPTFDREGQIVDGNNEHLYPRYTLYYAVYSETMRELVDQVLRGGSVEGE